MSSAPIVDRIRIIPRPNDFLDRNVGASGEVFFNRATNSLRVYSGKERSGFEIARADLTNVDTSLFQINPNIATVTYTVTIENTGEGNKYVLNGDYWPELNFVVGYTYVFDQTDPTNVYYPNQTGGENNQHPLNFSADDINGEPGGGTVYTDNVIYKLDNTEVTKQEYWDSFEAATQRTVQILVTSTTPDTLYYWCQNHVNMGKAITVANPGTGSSAAQGVEVSETAPESPSEGDLWWDSTDGNLYIYYNDSDSGQWTTASTVFGGLVDVNATTLNGESSTFYLDYNNLTNTPDLTTIDATTLNGQSSTFYLDYNNLTNTPENTETYTSSDFDNDFSNKDTDELLEGTTNLYYTDSRARNAVSASGDLSYDPTTGEFSVTVAAGYDSDNFDTDFGNKSTDDLTEGTANLYYTDSRVDSHLSGGTGVTYSNGAISVGQAVASSDSVAFAGATINGLTTLQQTTEVLNRKDDAQGTMVHDFSTGAIWYHGFMTSDFTANFTNVPTTENRAINVVLVLDQDSTPVIPTAVQIDGVSQTINWFGAVAPTGTANQIDIVSFTLIREDSVWLVLGSLNTFG